MLTLVFFVVWGIAILSIAKNIQQSLEIRDKTLLLCRLRRTSLGQRREGYGVLSKGQIQREILQDIKEYEQQKGMICT